MKLVGGQQLNWAAGDHSLYARLFARLPKDVRGAGDVLRYVGYESRQEPGNSVRFLGAEVDAFDQMPHDLVGWELTDTNWTVWRPEQGGLSSDWQEEIHWLWRDHRDGKRTGEFHAQGPHDWGRNGVACEVLMVANAYFAADGHAPQDEVQLVDYDGCWPDEFSAMAGWLRRELGQGIALRAEHYGSTAIPGMPAKPVIDILVEVPSFREAKQRAIPLLNSHEWEYWWYSEHMVFIKRQEFLGQRTHHIHMAPRGHAIWNGLAFRDYLRTHPDDARRYADLKRALAAAHQRDREAYTAAKTALVSEITTRAIGLRRQGDGILPSP